MSVKRYSIANGDEITRGYPASMNVSRDGSFVDDSFVLFSDYAALKEENERLKLNLKHAGGALKSLRACNVVDDADRVSFDDESGGRLTITIGGILDDIDASIAPKEPANEG